MSSVPSGCALSAQPLGHCVCVPPRGGRPRNRPASENPQVRPQSSNSAFTPSIGPILTRACVPVCVRSATEHGARPPNDGAPTVNFPTVAAANITAIRDLSTARCGRPSEVRAECQKSNRRMRARLATAASAAYRRRRCLRAAPALTPPNGRPIPLGPRRVRSRARRRYAAGALSMGPPSGAPGRPQRPLQCLPAGAGACKRLGRVAAHAVAWVACAEHAGPWRTAVACSAGRSAAPSRRCPFGVPTAVARLRQFGRRGDSEPAPDGPGLASGWWQVAPGPVRAVRTPVRSCCGRARASNRCMHAFQTVSRIIEIQSPVCVTTLVPMCSYVFFNYIPCCRVQKTASPKVFETIGNRPYCCCVNSRVKPRWDRGSRPRDTI